MGANSMTGTQSIAAFSTGVSSRNGLMYEFTGARTRVPVTQSWNGWTEPVMERMQQLIRLPMGWDGYRGQPVSLVNAIFALQVLNVICGPDTRVPQIVPGPEGDLQIEWHTLQGDLELHVKGPNDVHAWYCAIGGDPEGEERDLTVDYVVVAEWVREVAEPPFANAAAA
jgi:hypothetical protein